jgi:tellurite resistance protein TehA-like permease
VFPEFVPDKVMWAMAVLATVAIMVSRAHADVPGHPAHGFHTSYWAVSFQASKSGR